MSDNLPFSADPTKVVAADEIGGVLHQRVKLEHGADGSATDVSTASPLPTENRGNVAGTGIASAAFTSTQNSADISNIGCRGVQAILNVTAGTTLSLVLTIQAKDPVSGSYYKLNADPSAVTGTGLTVYELFPGIGATSGGVTQRTSASLPRTFRITVTHGNANSATYSVGYSLIA